MIVFILRVNIVHARPAIGATRKEKPPAGQERNDYTIVNCKSIAYIYIGHYITSLRTFQLLRNVKPCSRMKPLRQNLEEHFKSFRIFHPASRTNRAPRCQGSGHGSPSPISSSTLYLNVGSPTTLITSSALVSAF